jgi:hypothetical protein
MYLAGRGYTEMTGAKRENQNANRAEPDHFGVPPFFVLLSFSCCCAVFAAINYLACPAVWAVLELILLNIILIMRQERKPETPAPATFERVCGVPMSLET